MAQPRSRNGLIDSMESITAYLRQTRHGVIARLRSNPSSRAILFAFVVNYFPFLLFQDIMMTIPDHPLIPLLPYYRLSTFRALSL
jgi:hypothetical protein